MDAYLTQWKNLYRLRRVARWMLRALPVGAALSLGFSLPLMFSDALLRREFLILSGLLILGSVFLGGLLALLWPVQALSVARHVERACNLQERLSTALEYRPRTDHPLYAALQQDALRSAAQVSPWPVLAFHLPPWQLWLTLALLALNVLTGMQRAPFQRAAHKREVQHAIQQEIQAVDSLREQITQETSLTPEEKARLEDILSQTRQELANAQTLEEANAALETGKQFLKTLSPAQAQELAQALQSGGQALSASPALQEVGQALAQGDLLNAAQQLENLDIQSMSPTEREAIAGQLNTLAQNVAGSDPALAEKLRQAAQAIQAGSPDAAQALQQAAEALRQDAARIQQAAAAAQLSQALSASQQRLLYSGQAGTSQQGSTPPNGLAPGTGQGLWNGQGAGGTGSGSGQSAPGNPAGNTPIQPGNGAQPSGNSPTYDPLTAPDPRLSGGADSITLPGTSSEGETISGESNTLPPESAPLTVPYTEALPQFLDAYQQALDNENIPPQLRDVIREYFGSLEP